MPLKFYLYLKVVSFRKYINNIQNTKLLYFRENCIDFLVFTAIAQGYEPFSHKHKTHHPNI